MAKHTEYPAQDNSTAFSARYTFLRQYLFYQLSFPIKYILDS